MSRLRWFPFSSKSLVRKLLFRPNISVQSSDVVLLGKQSQFQMGFIHSSSSAHWCPSTWEQAEFAHGGLPFSKRYVHATGHHRSVERDYYDILGISENADRDEIKKAYHALAKKYHPDANRNNPSAKRKFQEIREAYETLQDPEKKAHYDLSRKGSGRSSSENAGFSDRDWSHFRHAHSTQFSDSFHKIFSEIFENEAEILNGDIQVELLLEFSEAAAGCTKQLSFNADVPCEFCRGRGHPLNASTRFCHTCNGVGRVTIPPFTTTCSSCKGFGRIIEDYCVACKGSGVREGVMNVKVTIPAGVDTGDVIRVPKAGNSSGLGRSSGDLIIKLKVSDNAVFSREGTDVYVDSYIHFTQAILGGNIEVPTLSGKMNVKIPKGVQHGQLVRLRSKGLPKSGFFVDRGDQYVRFCIKFPTSVTERQRVILEEFEKETMSNDSSSSEGSWWHHWINQLSSSNSFLQFSILMLIFIILGKALN